MTAKTNVRPLNTAEGAAAPASRSQRVPAIECRHVWKIYGKHEQRAHQAVKTENLSKEVCLAE